jgi:pimeloyl-ACP methyl ester carboxylesterase
MRLIVAFALVLSLLALVIGFAVVTGGPVPPPPLQSISDPFRSVDFSGLPEVKRFPARDGVSLAYRMYSPNGDARDTSVVLIHGSSSRSDGVHPLAQNLSRSGFRVFSIDMRGHGESGVKGQISYIGQLEDDLEDFLASVHPPGRRILVGFSAGGGFALRFAADARGTLFDGYVLLAPFLSQDASTYRPASGGWASVGVPRILGLAALNALGVSAFNHLPVIAFALQPEAQKLLTPQYSYSLAMNFRPHRDYQADIASVSRPIVVLVGEDDEQFFPERFAAEFAAAKFPVAISIIPTIGHIDLTLSPLGAASVAKAIEQLRAH